MDNRSKLILVVALLMSVGGIVMAAPTWASLATPAAFGGALVAVAGALSAAFGVKLP